jgi:O-antigen/teichoic acid export membrane protein
MLLLMQEDPSLWDGAESLSEEPAVASRSISHNAVSSLLVQIVGAVFTGSLTIFLARKLGSHGYGVLSLALGVSGLVLLPSDFGVSNSIARYVADHSRDHQRVRAVIADGLRLKLYAAVVVSAVTFAMAGVIAGWYHVPSLAWPIRALAISLLGQSLMLSNGLFVAVGRSDLQLRTAFTESLVQVTAAITLVLVGAGATGAAFGQAIGYLAGAGMTGLLLVRLLGRGILPHGPRFGPEAGRILSYAGALLIVDGAYTVFSQIDVLIIGSYLAAGSVALFSAPMSLIVFLGYPGAAVSAGVAPRLSRGAVSGPNVSAFLAGLRLLFVVQALLTAFVLGWAGLMVHIALGQQYIGAVTVLRALGPFVFLSGFGSLVSIGANFLGEAPKRVPVAVATMAINIGLDLLLVPRMGVSGAAVGTDAAYALYAPAHLFICQRALDLDLGHIGLSFVRTALACGVATGVLLLFGDSIALGRLPFTVLGGVLGVGVFVASLFLTGEITTADARRATAFLPFSG